MHIAASFMTVMARPSCTTVHLFGASPCCNFCACKCACTVVVRSPRGGWGTVTWQPSPRGWWGTVFPEVGNEKGGGVPRCPFDGRAGMIGGLMELAMLMCQA